MSNTIGSLAIILSGEGSGVGKMVDDVQKELKGLGDFVGNFVAKGVDLMPQGVGDMVKKSGLGQAPGTTFGDSLSSVVKAGRQGFEKEGVSGALKSAGYAAKASGSGALESIGPAIEGVGEFAAALGETLGPLGVVVAGAVAATGAVKTFGDQLAGFVSKSNPAVAERWTRTLDDISAVIGNTVQPVLELVTEGARMFGDALANILPSQETMRGLLAGTREQLGQLGEALKDPIFREFTKGAISWMINILELCAMAAKAAAQAFHEVLDTLRQIPLVSKLIGEKGSYANKSSEGMAAREAAFGSLEDVNKEVALSAYKASMGGDSTAERTANAAERTADAVEAMARNAGEAGDPATDTLRTQGL